MSVTERLANLTIPQVLVVVAVLIALRYVLVRQRTPVARSIAEIAESLAVALGLVFLLIRPFVIQAFFIPSASMHPTLLERDHILVNKFVYRFWEPKMGDVVVFKSPPNANSDGKERDFIKRVIGVPGDSVRITPGFVRVGEEQYSHGWLRRHLSDPTSSSTVKLTAGGVVIDGNPITRDEVAAAAGKPGAPVKVVPGKVILNGKALEEEYVAEDPDTPYPDPSVPTKWTVIDKGGDPIVRIPEGRLLVMGDNRNDSSDARVWGLLERDRVLGKAMVIFWPLDRIGWIR